MSSLIGLPMLSAASAALVDHLLRRFLVRIQAGALTVELPSGARLTHKGVHRVHRRR